MIFAYVVGRGGVYLKKCINKYSKYPGRLYEKHNDIFMENSNHYARLAAAVLALRRLWNLWLDSCGLLE
jgi:hypothetical protein